MLPPPIQPQQQPQFPPSNQANYQSYMYPPVQNKTMPPPPSGYPSNGQPAPQMTYNSGDDAGLANQFSGMNLGQPGNSYPPQAQQQPQQPPQQPMSGYPQQPQHQPNQPMGGYNTNYQQPPPMTGVPPMPPVTAQPQYGQQPMGMPGRPQMPPQQPQPAYQGGFPPVGMMPPTPAVPQPPMMQKTQSARAMADSMPNAIEVIENDKAQRGASSGYVFQTGSTGQMAPPLSTTDFVCREEGGNCNPRFLRSSLYAVPTSADLQKQVGLPFVLSIQPFARTNRYDQPIVLTDMGPQGPVRCIRCKAYMCPFFVFIDGGRRFQCALCGASTSVPQDYFAHLDHTGRRIDAFQRPELCLGSYEVVATAEYCKDNAPPLPPAFIFLLDVSTTAVRSGLVNLFCSRFITDILPHLPRDKQDLATGAVAEGSASPVQVGFITYDSQLHFYNLVRAPSAGTKAHMSVVADTEDVFVPSLEGFLVPPDPATLTYLLSTIPSQFSASAAAANAPQNAAAGSTEEPILGPAIQAGLEALKAANRCGKLFVMHTSLPTGNAPGKLKFREDRHLIGTDKEKTLLQPATDYYTKLGKECVEAGASVDLFLFPNSFIDVATVSEVPRVTAGNLFKYTYFQVDGEGEQFLSDLRHAVAQPEAFNAVMRVRTSTGTRPFESLGNVHLPNTTDVEFASLDANQTVLCEVKYDDKLSENDFVFIQAAVLYTSVGGHRRLRIHNLSLATSATAADIFRLADTDCLLTWQARLAVQRAPAAKTAGATLTEATAAVATALAGYRRLCTNSSNGGLNASSGELVLPETIKLMPLYVQCLAKTDAIKSAKNSTIDDRAYLLFRLNAMGPRETNFYVYPRVYPLVEVTAESESLPQPIRCSYERLSPEGVYLVENGVHAFIWCGLSVSPAWIQQVFGVTDVHVLDPDKATLPELDNPLSKSVYRLVHSVISQFTHVPKLRVIRQKELSESWVRRLMYEDRDDCGNASYVEYVCHVHKEVRALLK